MAGATRRQQQDRGPVEEAPRDLLARLDDLHRELAALVDRVERVGGHALGLATALRDRAVDRHLSSLDVEVLQDATDGRLRLGLLDEAGYGTVARVLAADRHQLEAVPGVGPKTSTQVLAAAREVAAALRAETRVRFDVERRPADHTDLLTALRDYEVTHRIVDPFQQRAADLAADLAAALTPARLETRPIRRFLSRPRRRAEARAALDRLRRLDRDPATALLRDELGRAGRTVAEQLSEPADVWDDYLARSVTYNGLLILITGVGPDEHAGHGFLPADIVERIRSVALDTSLLTVSLRGYQAFGARFALAQERAILGDEMGLGKTIQALAVLSHLRAGGADHLLVVCPASVLANWEHEIARHSRIDKSRRVHGPDRDDELAAWVDGGGIAVTTFDTLRRLHVPDLDLAAVVVDEAHYVKNPDAKRTRAVRAWLARSDHVLLLSGTPMENRVEEFRALVDHVRPELAATIRSTDGLAGPDAFRRAVAPVYLRRNQADVLSELPPRIETADWSTLEGRAAETYRAAVAEGNFMAMRRAAFCTPEPLDSPKLRRLLEIVGEAVLNDRNVVVFSYFREVVDRVHAAVERQAVDPITGDVPPLRRQRLVDEFSARKEPTVLVCQIEAGGVGLNIQAASVVVLTEPQWKPTTEEQAIARCHRLGQVRPVEVHRLLTENTVDEHLVRILARKSALFADYASRSVLADAAPEALGVTDGDRVDDVVDRAGTRAEHERWIIEVERDRLGLVDS